MSSTGYADVRVTGGGGEKQIQEAGHADRDVSKRHASSMSEKQKSRTQVGWLGSQGEETHKKGRWGRRDK